MHRHGSPVTEFRIYTPLASQWRRPMPKKLPVLQKGKRWFGVLQIPEGQSGKFAIRHQHHPAGAVFSTASARTQIFAQHTPVRVIASEPIVVHELREGKSLWMTDLPIEQAQIDPILASMRGRVLVGGLGIGYAAQVLARKTSVKEVVVIEKSPDVIELVAQHIRGTNRRKVLVIQDDLHAWLAQNQRERFDWAFYDIWAADGERVFFSQVVPLRRLTGQICDPERVRCWNEDVMRGQLLMHGIVTLNVALGGALGGAPGVDLSLDRCCEPIRDKMCESFNMLVPFFRALRDGRVPRDVAQATEVLVAFVRDYGIPGREVLT